MSARCQGRPNEPCPRKAYGTHSQGELTLCRECEEFRFPELKSARANKGKDKTVRQRQGTRTRGSTNQCTADVTKANVTTPDPDAGPSSDNDGSFCPACHESVSQSVDSKCITCDICKDSFHDICTGLSMEVFSVLVSIVKDAGWVCADCRTASRSKITALQSSLSCTNEELSIMRSLMSGLKCEIDKVKSDITVMTSNHSRSQQFLNAAKQPTNDSSSDSTPSVGGIMPDEVKIRTIVHDINRRKSNVVICGLPEPVSANETEKRDADRNTVVSIFEEHLDVKPSLSHLGCVRLGKIESHVNKPRKLLVHFSSEAAANSILKCASLLRRSDDPAIASNVFINPDMSPADAKIAYEKRQRKRELRNGGGTSHSSTHDSIQDSSHENESNNNNKVNLAGSTTNLHSFPLAASNAPATSGGTPAKPAEA